MQPDLSEECLKNTGIETKIEIKTQKRTVRNRQNAWTTKWGRRNFGQEIPFFSRNLTWWRIFHQKIRHWRSYQSTFTLVQFLDYTQDRWAVEVCRWFVTESDISDGLNHSDRFYATSTSWLDCRSERSLPIWVDDVGSMLPCFEIDTDRQMILLKVSDDELKSGGVNKRQLHITFQKQSKLGLVLAKTKILPHFAPGNGICWMYPPEYLFEKRTDAVRKRNARTFLFEKCNEAVDYPSLPFCNKVIAVKRNRLCGAGFAMAKWCGAGRRQGILTEQIWNATE